jgi:hypothetical protein
VNDRDIATALLASGRPSRADVFCQWSDTDDESTHCLARVYDLPGRGLVLAAGRRQAEEGEYLPNLYDLAGADRFVYLRCRHGGHGVNTARVLALLDTTREIRADRSWPRAL